MNISARKPWTQKWKEEETDENDKRKEVRNQIVNASAWCTGDQVSIRILMYSFGQILLAFKRLVYLFFLDWFSTLVCVTQSANQSLKPQTSCREIAFSQHSDCNVSYIGSRNSSPEHWLLWWKASGKSLHSTVTMGPVGSLWAAFTHAK